MNSKEQDSALFWCGLLHSLIYGEIKPEEVSKELYRISEKEVLFPNGSRKKPSYTSLKRKWELYQKGGFEELFRKKRKGGHSKSAPVAMIQRAIELKKDQPKRSYKVINAFLEREFGKGIARSTLYEHLKKAGATRLKLGVTSKPVRIRWTKEHTHDLWIGDFQDGPYVLDPVTKELVPTQLSSFADVFSRFVVASRYYYRQTLDVLIDTLLRAFSVHGVPRGIYVDNAKVYHSKSLKSACYGLKMKLLHRRVRDPQGGGAIERFFQTSQEQFESEVRAGEIMTLEELNQKHTAWLQVFYHETVHSETGQTPRQRYEDGLLAIRRVDMERVYRYFLQEDIRVVSKVFSDIRLNGRYYRVDHKLRGDKVKVRYDPYSDQQKIWIYSPNKEEAYLGEGLLHQRDTPEKPAPSSPAKSKYDFLNLLLQKHEEEMEKKIRNIDFSKVVSSKGWPFLSFAVELASLMGKKADLSSYTSRELETIKKFQQQHKGVSRHHLRAAVRAAPHKTIPYILLELQKLLS